mgnify:CR=1 FL=1
MTKEEAIVQIYGLKKYCEDMADSDESGSYVFDLDVQALDLALTALRPITREQVERVWKGEWKCQSDCGVTECTACKWNIEEYCGDYNFCPHCGAPMNDEAIQMVMERMKKLK